MSLVDTKPVQRLRLLYREQHHLTVLDGPTPSQEEWGKVLHSMEDLVALEKNLNQASWGLYTKLCMDQPLAL